MSIFLLLMNYIGAMIAVQLFRGDVASDVPMNFSQAFLSYLGMYQVGAASDFSALTMELTSA
jgi:hypothetical protein